jgi:hypothetical protein
MAMTPANKTPDRSTESEFQWKGAHALSRVYALNERCLELIAQVARMERTRCHLAIVNQHRSLWRSLSVAASKRAARTPYLLIDVHFQDVDWWRWAKAPRTSGRRGVPLKPAFSGRIASELMREALMLAWSTVAMNRGTASILLGMTSTVSDIIAALGPQDVERITARHSRHLRPRWEDFPAFWGRLLSAARGDDEHALHEVRLHGMQLIGSELLPRLNGGFIAPLPQHLKDLATQRER